MITLERNAEFADARVKVADYLLFEVFEGELSLALHLGKFFCTSSTRICTPRPLPGSQYSLKFHFNEAYDSETLI